MSLTYSKKPKYSRNERIVPGVERKPTGHRWEFRQYNPEKQRNEPVPVAQIPEHIRNAIDESLVVEFCKSWDAKTEALKHRAERLRAWKDQFHDFKKYLEEFAEFQKERAPNSWQNDVHWLETYAFGFFLSKSSLNNLNEWHTMYDAFRRWLKNDAKPLKYKKERLSLNSQVKVIKALNRFMDFSQSKGWISAVPKCKSYSRDATVTVTADDIFQEDEIQAIFVELKTIRPDSADLFWFLVHTGLRENEALGVSIDFVSSGKLSGSKSKKIHESLEKYGLGNYHGYLCLKSQPLLKSIRVKGNAITGRDGKNCLRNEVPRKPLKHRKVIEPKYYRYLPIHDEEAWNIIVERTNAGEAQFDLKQYGSSRDNYLLFDGMTASMFYNDLAKALARLKLRHRSPHKTRHTYFTWFYDKVNEDMFLAGCVGGHRDKRDVDRYCHLNELIGREMDQQKEGGRRLKKVG